MSDNIILETDSYKLTHWNQYPAGTTGVYSYFESRAGAKFDKTVFFGLQPILERLAGSVVTMEDVYEADAVSRIHFGRDGLFNKAGWCHIVKRHKGRLPVRIKALPEGTVVLAGIPMMTIENTDPQCYWLTNALESLLTHVWYPSTVATLSREVKMVLRDMLYLSGAPREGLDYMLQDFGFRGTTCTEAAEIGGAAHLVNFRGTDTLPALLFAAKHYRADLETLGFSVPATEHSVMTALGRNGEFRIAEDLLDNHPTGVLSIVADSYNIYDFVDMLGEDHFRARILTRDGVLVVRPDSVTRADPLPELLVVELAERLWDSFRGTTNASGLRVLDPHVRLLWGDGIDIGGIQDICETLITHGFSVENMACFGMGGGLLQRVNRDDQRFAFKSSAQERLGEWHDVFKEPLDSSKRSKPGRLKVVEDRGDLYVVREEESSAPDALWVVFEDGELRNRSTFDEIRVRAAV